MKIVPANQRRPVVLVFAILASIGVAVSCYLFDADRMLSSVLLWLSFMLNSAHLWYLYLTSSKEDQPKMYAEIQREKRQRFREGTLR